MNVNEGNWISNLIHPLEFVNFQWQKVNQMPDMVKITIAHQRNLIEKHITPFKSSKHKYFIK